MIVTSVFVARFPIHFELALSAFVTDPIETYVNGLGAFFLMVYMANPMAEVFSTCMLVGGWG